MAKEKSDLGLKLWTVCTFLLMVFVNAAANLLPINGLLTGEVSDAYANLFAPAASTFAIWGVIYLLLTLYVFNELGSFRENEPPARRRALRKTARLFSVTSLLNAGWIFSWHYRLIPLSMLLMALLLVFLILIALTLREVAFSPRETVFIRLPFSVYFGWITVATIANMTVLLVSLGWNGFGVSPELWTAAILAVGVVIGTVTMLRLRDPFYGLVFLWA